MNGTARVHVFKLESLEKFIKIRLKFTFNERNNFRAKIMIFDPNWDFWDFF